MAPSLRGRSAPPPQTGTGSGRRSRSLVSSSRAVFSKFPTRMSGGQRGRGRRQQRKDVAVVRAKEEDALSAPPQLDKSDLRSRHSSAASSACGDGDPHPFFLTPDAVLSPRADAWLFLFLSSCASASSLSVSSPAAWRGAAERTALAASGLSAAASLCVALGYRYRPSRGSLTGSDGGRGVDVLSNVTPELGLAVLTLVLCLVSAALVLQPSGYMAVVRTEIWNANLFFSTWISTSLACYLVADLLTTYDASGVLPRESSLVMGNAIARGWSLLFIAALSLMAFSLALRSGDVCSSALMETNVCQMTIVGIIFGFVGMLLPGGYLLVSLLERRTGSSSNGPKSMRYLLSSLLSVISLICYSINASFVTSPVLAPGTSEPCNVYFSSWICFAVSLYLCIRHAEAYLVPGSTRDIGSLAPMNVKASNQHILQRAPSRNSSTASPATQYSDDDDDGDDNDQNADDALTAMVESQSEDGPMLFLPVAHHGQLGTETSDLDEDSSYPSVTPSAYPLGGQRHHQYSQYQRQYQQMQHQPQVGREPHKPRAVSPAGGYQSSPSTVPSVHGGENQIDPICGYQNRSAADSVASSAVKSRVQAEPPESDEESLRRSNAKEDPNGHNFSSKTFDDEFIDTRPQEPFDEVVEVIDTKLQARMSSSSSEGRSLRKSTSRSGKSRGSRSGGGSSRRRKKKKSKNPEGRRGHDAAAQSFHADSQPQPPTSTMGAIAKNENGQINATGYLVETIYSESEESSAPSPLNPLDRTTRPPARSFHQAQPQRSVPSRDPTFHSDPSFRTSKPLFPDMDLQQAQMQQQQPQPVDSSPGTSVATTQDGLRSKATSSSKSKGSSKSSSRSGSRSKSQSSSRGKKRRSKSRERKRGGDRPPIRASKSPSAARPSGMQPGHHRDPSAMSGAMQGATQHSVRSLARSAENRTANSSSRGPPTISNDSNSSDAFGQGPATMSASSGGGNSGVTTDSGPLTDDEPLTNEEGMEELGQMGRVGPGRMEPPLPSAVTRSPGGLYGDGDTITDPGRPMSAIHGASPDCMSMVSDPTMDGCFGPPGDDYHNSSSRNQHHHRPQDYPMSSHAAGGNDALRYSYGDLSTGQNSSSETNENNKALRQGAVDKMVMEALRQAQEARQGGGGGLGGPGHSPPAPPAAFDNLHRQMTHGTNPQGHSTTNTPRPPAPGGRGVRQPSMRSRDSSRSRLGGSSKSPHGGRKQQQRSYRKHQHQAGKSSSSGRASGSGGKVRPRNSMHSFYSGSEDDTSYGAEDAFAC
mmetsp:Transcript_38088/g.81301  ORF Transcript_38088/g.81301 Transcript_38088/m.81301 type:complete len:1267 (+) Transcript_38088:285-4085(+)|eukprot:CAMPEP_0172531924 /NCGR_PEP_ID=MMETSP1067-20121228/5150_1 /TAXON_ID=265564 ORGANISM="Thalassiosira punctigera, Strain Tpunct2005C2" /NCGR_SAMPLE_ID=MMETSP1067 /ASSEMBLY_ACC=CAM_ASM_000444 /LENGTH=1266 /DNA_ID=CAMNT_0013316363 /DNA_START=261 /DNA_END=4061 /DNA_ORIENTATION=-